LALAPVRRDRGDDVADPAKQPTAADPQARRQDQPEDPTKEIAIIELPKPGKDGTEDGCRPRILNLSHDTVIVERSSDGSADEQKFLWRGQGRADRTEARDLEDAEVAINGDAELDAHRGARRGRKKIADEMQ